MAKDCSISNGSRRFGQRPVRTWRPWCWGLALWLRNGGVAVAFYLAASAGTAGVLALVAFVGSLLLREVMEATSQGD